jgi:hypothetical protein
MLRDIDIDSVKSAVDKIPDTNPLKAFSAGLVGTCPTGSARKS